MEECEHEMWKQGQIYNLFLLYFIKYIWALEQREIIQTLAQ